MVIDASSLILLAKATILEKLTEKNQLIMPKKVYTEVIKGKEKALFDAFLTEKLVEKNKLKVEKVDKKSYKKIWKLFGLWAGEAEVLALAIKKNVAIVSDDKKCINAAKALNIACITSLDIVVALFKKKQINKQKTIKSLETLEEYGWYKGDVIKFYKKKIK